MLTLYIVDIDNIKEHKNRRNQTVQRTIQRSRRNQTARKKINIRMYLCMYLYYRIAGKFGGQNVWRIYSFQAFGGKKVWRMNRSAKGLSMVTTNLDGFSLANCRRFAKFTKLSPRQTFPLYGIY